MKRKDWFWCGAVLFALATFVSVQCVQDPLYSGIAGGVCAFAAAILFGYGLRASAEERSAADSKRMEEKQKHLEEQRQTHTADVERILNLLEALRGDVQSAQKSTVNEGEAQRESIAALLDYLRNWFDAQQQSYTVALEQLQTNTAAVTGEIQALRKAAASESQSQEKALAQLSDTMRVRSESDQAQAQESAKAICALILEQHTALRTMLESQGKASASYYKFMVDQPWSEIKTLSETLQSTADQLDSILSAVESIQSDAEKQLKNALNKLKEDSQALQEKLQNVCDALEEQGQESRDAMDRVLQGYANVTAQDVEVLTALARDARV